MNDRTHIAMTETASNIGEKELVSPVELLSLCNFAHIGLLYAFLEMGGDATENSQAEIRDIVAAIDENFAPEGRLNGCSPLTECCAAILASERFGKYILSRDKE